MKNKISLYILVLFTTYFYAQKNQCSDVIGTWEMLEMVNNTENQIDLGELILEDNERLVKQSVDKIIKDSKDKDPRLSKWYYVFNSKNITEFRLGIGGKFKSKIIEDEIYKFGKPYYKILFLKGDTLKIKQYDNQNILILKKVNTNLDGLEIANY